jgi:D-alanyl-D-alanine carboxypeptidase (penicillin-binding protein 5/6)
MSRNRTKHTGRRVLYILVFLVLLLGIANYARPLPSIAANSAAVSSIMGTASLNWPGDGASAAIGAAGYGVLASGSDPQLPTASIAKLITALTVLHVKPLSMGQQGPDITITAQDVTIYNNYVAQDGSVVPVQEGEQLTEYQALQAMLLPSANNIADALAIWAFGSLPAYATAGNQEAQSLGLKETVIGSDASGLSPSTVSSPTDLITLGSAVMRNPVLAQIVDEPSTTLPVAGQVLNVNSLLGQDGINGIKTGNSDQVGGNYLFSAPYSLEGHSVTIIGAVMEAPTLQAAMQDGVSLLSSAKHNFTLEKPVSVGQIFGTYTAPWGETVSAVAQKDMDIIAWRGSTLTPTLRLSALTGEKPSGSQIGIITFSSGNFTTSEPIVLKQTYSPPSFWWRLTRH